MRIRLLTITHKTPAWVQAGFADYAKRLPHACQLELIEIPAEKRLAQSDLKKIGEREGEKMLALIKPHHHVVALAIQGKMWSTEELGQQLTTWQRLGETVDLLVGGPEGLSSACLKRANQQWSLSLLTFPHFIIRILIAEQLYRANTILQNHPYHR